MYAGAESPRGGGVSAVMQVTRTRVQPLACPTGLWTGETRCGAGDLGTLRHCARDRYAGPYACVRVCTPVRLCACTHTRVLV